LREDLARLSVPAIAVPGNGGTPDGWPLGGSLDSEAWTRGVQPPLQGRSWTEKSSGFRIAGAKDGRMDAFFLYLSLFLSSSGKPRFPMPDPTRRHGALLAGIGFFALGTIKQKAPLVSPRAGLFSYGGEAGI